MINKNFIQVFFPILLLFIISNGIFLTFRASLARWNINTDIVIAGNLILFIATGVSFYLYYKALRNNNVQAFLRMIYGGMFLKMMICLFTAFIYIMIAGKTVNKGGVITCLFLYLIYSIVELVLLLKKNNSRTNA